MTTEETQPLLSSGAASTQTPGSLPPDGLRTRCTWPWLRVVVLAVLAGAFCCVGEDLLAAPRIRLFESALCARYYAEYNPAAIPIDGQIPEHLCKVEAVQSQLALVLGGQFFFDSVPAILFPVPYGLLADNYGRKWIMVMASIGYTLSYVWTLLAVGVLDLPLPWVWLSSAFFMLGGGSTIATYLITTVVADVIPPELRSTVFFYRYCTDSLAELVIPPLTAYLMSCSVWIPLSGAVLFQGLSSLVCSVIPETAPLPMSVATNDADAGAESQMSDDLAASAFKSSVASQVAQIKRTFTRSYKLLTGNPATAGLISTFVLTKVGRQNTTVLFQYVSKRYGWTIAEAGLLMSVRAFVNIILYTLILPALAIFLLRRVGFVFRADLQLARGSALFLTFGAGLLFLAATPAVMVAGVILLTLGMGFPHAARSLVTSVVDSDSSHQTASNIACLYALISLAEGLGSLIAALGLSWTFRLGLSLGRQWLGLPFGLTAILFGAAGVIVFRIRTHDV